MLLRPARAFRAFSDTERRHVAEQQVRLIMVPLRK